MTKNLTIRIDDETAKKMERYREVNWSEVARKAINKYITGREAAKMYDTAVKSHETRGTYRLKTGHE
jgi:predicted transcriptional regulator